MHAESPEFKRCCFCLPLRRGLIGWGYLRLILDVLAAIRLVFSALWIFRLGKPRPWEVAFILAVIIYVLIDTVFTVLLVTAAHKKNAKLLRISYIYNVVWLILILTFFAYVTYFEIDRALLRWKFETRFSPMWQRHPIVIDLLVTLAMLYSIIFVQVYMTLLTRSEAKKLQNQKLEVLFVNNAAESEARCVGAATEHNDAQDSDNTQDTEKNIEYKQVVVV